MRPRAYIGITGFMNRNEVDETLEALPKGSKRLVMIGVLVSSKTMRGVPNKWPKRYPKPEEVANIFPAREHVLNLIHYNQGSDSRTSYVSDMINIMRIAGPNCHGFQLNMPWPGPQGLHTYHHASSLGIRPKQETIVLQCGSKAMEACGRSPRVIAQRLREYQDLVDYVLIDPSGGVGQDFDLKFAMECMEAFAVETPWVRAGVAGGLHAGNIKRAEPLIGEWNLSIDAEGRLRNEADDLNIEATKAYLRAADDMFSAYLVP